MRKLVPVALFCLLLSGGFAVAQDGHTSGENKTSVNKQNPEATWASVTWEEDVPYRQARKSIDLQLLAGASPVTLAEKFAQSSQLNDKLAQFKWGYASYEAARKSKFPAAKLQEIKERVNFMPTRNPAHSAEFARLLFLTYSRLGPFSNLADVGQRLVKRFPKDFEVKWFAFYSLTPGRPSHLPVALEYARELKQMQPNHPKAPFYMTHIYTSIWATTWDRKDANKVIAEHRAVLKELPPDDPRREFALSQIKWVEKAQPILEKKKHLRPHRSWD